MIYDIQLCRADQVEALVNFLRCHWSADHIFVKNRDILDFQHKNSDGSYNFWIANNTQTQEIDGVLGFISTSFFDSALAPLCDQWGAIWKVRTDVKNDEIGVLGLALFDKIISSSLSHGSIGISLIAKKIYKLQRQVIGSMKQYYIKNEACKEFRIGVFDNHIPEYTHCQTQVALRPVSINEIELLKHVYYPQKSAIFIQNRYLNHPIYQYQLMGVFNCGVLCAVLVLRCITTQQSRCVRIVDVYGDIGRIPNIYSAMQQYLGQIEAEYIDCMNYGIDQAEFIRIGFTHLDSDQEQVVVPNYFEPFMCKNIVIELAYKAPENCTYVVFKGDSDQDRPNTI